MGQSVAGHLGRRCRRDARVHLAEPGGDELRLRRIVFDHENVGRRRADLGQGPRVLRQPPRQGIGAEDGVEPGRRGAQAVELISRVGKDHRARTIVGRSGPVAGQRERVGLGVGADDHQVRPLRRRHVERIDFAGPDRDHEAHLFERSHQGIASGRGIHHQQRAPPEPGNLAEHGRQPDVGRRVVEGVLEIADRVRKNVGFADRRRRRGEDAMLHGA